MSDTPLQTAAALRRRFKSITQERRDANQAFSVRVWRGLSWLERGEKEVDVEGQFISLWIAFNAIHGHLESDGVNAPDHASWQAFLAGIVKADTDDCLGQIMWADHVGGSVAHPPTRGQPVSVPTVLVGPHGCRGEACPQQTECHATPAES